MPYKDPAQRRIMVRLKYKNDPRTRELVRAHNKKYHSANKERLNEERAERYRNNIDKANEYHRQYRLKNKSKIATHSAGYWRANKESLQKYHEQYRQLNPQVSVNAVARRRLRVETTMEGEKAIEDFIKLVRCTRRIACYYCKKLTRGKSAHIDHVVPLSRGGAHSPTNLCASCPPCNREKHAKLLSEWKRAGQQVLPL